MKKLAFTTTVLMIFFISMLSGNQPGSPQSVSASAPSAADCTSLANWQCVETRPGLSLCRANNICLVKLDLNNSSLRPRVVIAPNGGTAWLSSMASGAGAFAAINGDYFSGCPDTVPPLNCGEGLTYIDGTDYTDYTGSEWQNRRSLGFNDSYDPNIGFHYDQGGYHRQLLGGGPQVTFGGEYRWRCWYQNYNTEGDCACQDNTVVINDELFGCSANNWWSRPQSFAGFSEDGNTLYLAVSEPGYNKTPHEMHDVLWVMGARSSLKLDGGGSSGMYFNDGGYEFAWNGGREVANAWVIVPDSGPPPTCNPSADQVALYANTDFGGDCVTLNVGEYPNPSYLGDLGNDNAESIRVGGNVQALLCEHDNYQGRCETFTGDDSNLGDNYIGANVVSSVKVQQPDTTPPTGQITSPTDGAVIGTCPLLIQATASDAQSGVSHVEFHAYYDDGWHHLGDDHTSPYSWNWDCSAVGDQGVWLTIHVWDNAGNEVMDPGGYVYVTLSRATVGPLAYAGYTVDDDNSGQSNGDGDGIVESGETIELYVTLHNEGSSTATGVDVVISTNDSYVTWPYNTSSSYADISGGGTGINSNDFDFAVDPTTPNGHTIHFDLAISAANGGPWSGSFDITVVADRYIHLPVVVRD